MRIKHEVRVSNEGARDKIESTPYTLREVLEYPETGPPQTE